MDKSMRHNTSLGLHNDAGDDRLLGSFESLAPPRRSRAASESFATKSNKTRPPSLRYSVSNSTKGTGENRHSASFADVPYEDDYRGRRSRSSLIDDDDDDDDDEDGVGNNKTALRHSINVRKSMNRIIRQQSEEIPIMEQSPLLGTKTQKSARDFLQKQFQNQQKQKSAKTLLMIQDDTSVGNQSLDNIDIKNINISAISKSQKNGRKSSKESSNERLGDKPQFISFEFEESTNGGVDCHDDGNDDADDDILLASNYQPRESTKQMIMAQKLFPSNPKIKNKTPSNNNDDVASLPSFATSDNSNKTDSLFDDEEEDDDDDESYSYENSSEEYDTDDDGGADDDDQQYDPLEKKHKDVMNQYARREQKNVQCWRIIVIVLLIVIGSSAIASTYITLKNVHYDTYLQTYTMHVDNIRASTRSLMDQLLTSITEMSNDVTLAAKQQVNNNQSFFPYVRVPYFEVSAREVRLQSGIEMFAWSPFVRNTDTAKWNAYYAKEAPLWYEESKNLTLRAIMEQQQLLHDNTTDEDIVLLSTLYESNDTLRDYIWQGYPPEPAHPANIYAPVCHVSPPPFSIAFLNYNMLKETSISNLLQVIPFVREGIFSPVDPTLIRLSRIAVSPQDHESFHAEYIITENNATTLGSSFYRPHSVHVQPVFSDFYNGYANIVGFLASVVAWDRYVGNLLPEGVSGIYAVLKNNCGQVYTYKLVGPKAEYVGEGDLHEMKYSSSEEIVLLTTYRYNETAERPGHCVYSFYLYSSTEYQESIDDNIADKFTVGISLIFLVVVLSFCIYDSSVRRRNAKIMNAAVRSNQIVSSIFPSHVTDKLLKEQEIRDNDAMSVMSQQMSRHAMLKGDFLGVNSVRSTTVGDDDDENTTVVFQTRPPIADLFTDTTIMFADIAGFTAWSSSREPTQVFVLLETVYHAFDEIARKRRVFKVETVGDCYVAVCGLPNPRKDHAITMCRFARDILFKMRELTHKLQRSLGPETEDLAMRVGLHSGPVTAGVLRGQNTRFQLFGDTMNTAARMEQNGVRDKIHLSKETANLVIESGKSKWVTPREDKIVAKGKGTLETYWLVLATEGGKTGSVVSGSSSHKIDKDFAESVASGMFGTKESRLVDWNADVLVRLLKQIVARRKACPPDPGAKPPNESRYTSGKSNTPFHEVCEIIEMAKFDARSAINQQDMGKIDLDETVKVQVYNYVTSIAAIYHDNPFHSFEHASHVTQSVIKLLSRIVAPSHVNDPVAAEAGKDLDSADKLHDHTYGITSDPLVQFACAFSSLIHDADHQGVPNAQLIKENTPASSYYQQKSVAEQNSVDLAWQLLMQDEFKDFRAVIYATDDELRHFRQLVINCVMATDIVDKELKALRNNRWEKAFSESEQKIEAVANDRKATIVIEHLIQASDVSHTMQHWSIYRRWNEKFFHECYKAYLDGRAEKDPSDGWYQGELGFFDFYIIPLAKKLKECGVFGVSSAEYLDYATKNRQEWEEKGEEVVHEMIEKAKKKLNSIDDCDNVMPTSIHMRKTP